MCIVLVSTSSAPIRCTDATDRSENMQDVYQMPGNRIPAVHHKGRANLPDRLLF